MKKKAYSSKRESHLIFFDLLNLLCRRGWCCVDAGVSENRQYLFSLTFHIDPEDVDKLCQVFSVHLSGDNFWHWENFETNRFSLYPQKLHDKYIELGHFGDALDFFKSHHMELAFEAADALIRLSDRIFQDAILNNFYRTKRAVSTKAEFLVCGTSVLKNDVVVVVSGICNKGEVAIGDVFHTIRKCGREVVDATFTVNQVITYGRSIDKLLTGVAGQLHLVGETSLEDKDMLQISDKRNHLQNLV